MDGTPLAFTAPAYNRDSGQYRGQRHIPGGRRRPTFPPVQHRHLDSPGFSPAAWMTASGAGGWQDGVMLRRAAIGDPRVADRVRRVCASGLGDPAREGGQRVAFWKMYAERLAASVG